MCCVCMCMYVFCVCDTENYLHSGFEAWLFSLLINIQCEQFISLPLYRLYSLPITLFRVSYRPSSPTRLFRSRCFHYHPLTFLPSLSFNRILFQSHSLTLATHSRVKSGTRVSYEHSSRGNHRYCARSADFRSAIVQTNDVGGKTQTPFVVKSLCPTSTRIAIRIIKIPLDRGGRGGTLSFSRHAAVELGRGDPRRIETQARGGSVSQSRYWRFR